MDLLWHLSQAPRRFRGTGRNHENQQFVGLLDVEPLVSGSAVLLRYGAEVKGVGVVHTETTLLAKDAEDRLCLWPVMAELPFVLPHVCIHSASIEGAGIEAIFASGKRDDEKTFREEITVVFHPGGRLIYSHAWALPHGAFRERARCDMVPDEV